jgi:zinc transporter 1/2/3
VTFTGIKPKVVILYITTFSLVTVFGAGIGIALSESMHSDTTMQSPLVTILQGLASGTLLYVAFFGILEKERQSGTNKIFQV